MQDRLNLTPKERRLFKSLRSPAKIQDFLDQIPYSSDHYLRSPRQALQERSAACFDGALLAAAALRVRGIEAKLINLFAYNDDQHILAVFRLNGLFGAIAKSNFTGLRYRDPVYRSIRELVMSYFEGYFNLRGQKSLRAYVGPLSLGQFDALDWFSNVTALAKIAERLDAIHQIELLTPAARQTLAHVDQRSFRAGMLGINIKGVRPG